MSRWLWLLLVSAGCPHKEPSTDTGGQTNASDVDTDTDTDTDTDVHIDTDAMIEAVDDVFEVPENRPESLWLTQNDLSSAPPATISGVTQPSFGTVSIDSAGGVTYISDAGYLGPDSFDYDVMDATGQDTATVNLEVVPAFIESQGWYNLAPMALLDGTYRHVYHDTNTDPPGLRWRESADGLLWGATASPVPGIPTSQHAGSFLVWDGPSTPGDDWGLNWMERDPSNLTHVWYAPHLGGGALGTSVQVTSHTASSFVYADMVAFDDGELVLFSTLSGANGSEIDLTRSTDGGATWTLESSFGSTGFYGTVVDALVHDDEVWVLTSADRTFKRNLELYHSTDRGVTFSPAIDITGYTVEQNWTADFATLALDTEDVLHLIWEQQTPLDPDSRIFHTTSTDHGLTWPNPYVQVSDAGVHTQAFLGHHDLKPRIAFGGGHRVYALWVDAREGNQGTDPTQYNWDVYLSISLDGGHTWGADQRVNDEPEQLVQRTPSWVVEPGSVQDRIVISWADGRFDDDGVAPILQKLLFTERMLP